MTKSPCSQHPSCCVAAFVSFRSVPPGKGETHSQRLSESAVSLDFSGGNFPAVLALFSVTSGRYRLRHRLIQCIHFYLSSRCWWSGQSSHRNISSPLKIAEAAHAWRHWSPADAAEVWPEIQRRARDRQEAAALPHPPHWQPCPICRRPIWRVFAVLVAVLDAPTGFYFCCWLLSRRHRAPCAISSSYAAEKVACQAKLIMRAAMERERKGFQFLIKSRLVNALCASKSQEVGFLELNFSWWPFLLNLAPPSLFSLCTVRPFERNRSDHTYFSQRM